MKNGKPYALKSEYTKEQIPFTPILQDPRGFHVGTSKYFCLDYYSGMLNEDDPASEILLKLEIQIRDLQTPEMLERWSWPCPTEAIVKKAKILAWELIPQ